MFASQTLRNTACVILTILGAGIVTRAYAVTEAPSPDAVLKILERMDSKYFGEFAIQFHVVYPVEFHRGYPGRSLRELTITGKGSVVATESRLVRLLEVEDAVQRVRSFSPTPAEHDQKVLINVARLSLDEEDFVGTMSAIRPVDLAATVEVAPDPFTQGYQAAQLDIPGDERPTRTIENILGLFAVGRGFSRHIEAITEVTVVNGMLHVQCEGRAHNRPCKWSLVVDPGADYMVRRAEAWRADSGFIFYKIENHGAKSLNGLIAPEVGHFWRGHCPDSRNDRTHKYEVTPTGYAPQPMSRLIEMARTHLRENLPEGTEVYDYRNHDYRQGNGFEQPERYIVGEDEIMGDRNQLLDILMQSAEVARKAVRRWTQILEP